MDKNLEALGLRAVLRKAHVHLPRAITDALGGPEEEVSCRALAANPHDVNRYK